MRTNKAFLNPLRQIHCLLSAAPAHARPCGRLARFGLVDLLVLILYASTLAFGLLHHLPGDDEAQAWMLARDSSLQGLLLHQLHYEGAPGLWPVLLWCAIRLHLPFTALGLFGACFAVAGVGAWLAWSPLPRILRWLLPFTYFLAFQYAIVARPYVLFPLLLFLLCHLYTQPRPRPLAFALVAGLLINLSLAAAVIGGVFALLYLGQLLRARRTPIVTGATSVPGAVRLGLAATVLLGLSLASIAVAFPAPDVVLAGDSTHTFATAGSPLERLLAPEVLPPGSPALDTPLDLTTFNDALRVGPAKPAAAALPPLNKMLARIFVFGADAITFPIAESNLLALAVVFSLILWLAQRRQLLLLLPWLVGILISVNVLTLDHHTGQFALALVAAAWIALGQNPRPTSAGLSAPWLNATLLLFTLFAVLLQIAWAWHALTCERNHPSDPGRATAAYLRGQFRSGQVAGFAYESVSAQPYSDENLFANWPVSYWRWSGPIYIDRRRSEACARHPAAVVVADLETKEESLFNQWVDAVPAGRHPYQPMLAWWQQHGYRVTETFCGDRVMRAGVSARYCELVLEPGDPK